VSATMREPQEASTSRPSSTEASVTSAPARRRTPARTTASISSVPMAMGTRTSLYKSAEVNLLGCQSVMTMQGGGEWRSTFFFGEGGEETAVAVAESVGAARATERGGGDRSEECRERFGGCSGARISVAVGAVGERRECHGESIAKRRVVGAKTRSVG
jgi:hypothetical protein